MVETISHKSGVDIVTGEGSRLVNFASSDYLGLTGSAEIIDAAINAAREFGFGTASAPTITGRTAAHRRLEATVARFLEAEDAVCFNSGWSANVGLLSTLLREGDCILSDEMNHASIVDGIRLAPKGVKKAIYRHRDVDDLEQHLARFASCARRFVITDGVFSMRGTLAPLAAITELCRAYDAELIVDDAHGIGALGRTGRGALEVASVLRDVHLVTGSFGKGLGGVAGGFVAGSKDFIALLQEKARPSIFSTTLPPFVVAGVTRALELIDEQPTVLQHLVDNVNTFTEAVRRTGRTLPAEKTMIVSIEGRSGQDVAAVTAAFRERGLWVVGFGYPVVPRGEALYRFQITIRHTCAHLAEAATAISEILGTDPFTDLSCPSSARGFSS